MSGVFLAAAGSAFQAAGGGGGGGGVASGLFDGGEQGHLYLPDATWVGTVSPAVADGVEDESGTSPDQTPIVNSSTPGLSQDVYDTYFFGFSGSDSWYFPNKFVADTSVGSSYACAVKFDSVTGFQMLYTNDPGSGTRDFQFRTNGTELQVVANISGGTTVTVDTSGLGLTTSGYYSIILNYGAATIDIYVNGVLEGTGANPNATVPAGITSSGSAQFEFGSRNEGANDRLNGDVYHLLHLDRLMTAQEIRDLTAYHQGLMSQTVTPSPLTSPWNPTDMFSGSQGHIFLPQASSGAQIASGWSDSTSTSPDQAATVNEGWPEIIQNGSVYYLDVATNKNVNFPGYFASTSGYSVAIAFVPTSVSAGIQMLYNCDDSGSDRVFQFRMTNATIDGITLTGATNSATTGSVLTAGGSYVAVMTVDGSNLDVWVNSTKEATSSFTGSIAADGVKNEMQLFTDRSNNNDFAGQYYASLLIDRPLTDQEIYDLTDEWLALMP